MAKQLYANNVKSKLAAPISAVALSLQVTATEGADFPALTGGDWFIATLIKYLSGVETAHEIIKVTAVTGDIFTIVRAQEGTTALIWAVDDHIQIRPTAGKATDVEDHLLNVANPHTVTKTQVGLSNVDNTSDANKPVSTAQSTAIGLKYDKTGGTLTGDVTVNTGAASLLLLQSSGVSHGRVQATATDVRLSSLSTLPLYIATNGVDRILIDSSGNGTFGTSGTATLWKFLGNGTGDAVVVESNDAGAVYGPNLILYRNSASPLAEDQLGSIVWRGKDGATGDQQYARISTVLKDPTAASEDGELSFEITVAGASTERLRLLPAGATIAGSINGLTLTAAATGFTVAGGTTSKTLTVSNTLTLSGTDASTLNIGIGGTLGTAAYTASTAYATSTQGTTADNALPTASFTAAAVTGKLITGFVSGAATVAATDTILQAINKLDGNVAEKSPTAGNASLVTVGTITTGTWNATAIADGKIASALTSKTYNGLSVTVATNTGTLTAGTSALVWNSSGTIGSAAFTASSAYATSAQGTLATNAQPISGKDTTGGYPGLTLFKLNLKNDANTFTNLLGNATTAIRNWTLPDKNGTVAMTSDITGTNSGTNTGDQTITLTGAVTGTGTGSFTTSLTTSAVTGSLITSFVSGAGTVAATDTILQAINKLDGNVAGKSPTAGNASLVTVGTVTTGTWNATAIADGKIASALTGKTYNGVTITAPASSATLTIANTGSLITSGAYAITLTATATTNVTLPTTGTLAAVGAANSWTAQQTLKEVKDTVHTITDGAAFEIDPANGSIQVVTLGAARTPAATNFEAGQCVLLGIDDGTAYAVTWTTVAPTWIKSGGSGAAPTLATSGFTWLLFWKVGSTMYGSIVGSA